MPPPFCILYKCMNEARLISEYLVSKDKTEYFCPVELKGFCARASAILFEILKLNKIESEICCNAETDGYHVFVRIGNLILDCTATQYGKDRLLIVPEEELKNNSHWNNIIKTFNSVKDLISYQKDIGWLEYEVAKKFNKKKFFKVLAV